LSGSSGNEQDSYGVFAAVHRELSGLLARPLAPGLYLVATPIGNLADTSLRAIATLIQADLLYCEDTRHSRRLLDRYGINRKLRSLHDHNEEAETTAILRELSAARPVALMSDAGTPLISDPGYKLARAASGAGHKVFAIPGPSAVLAALSASGLPTDCFTFAGFLPARSGQRLERLRELQSVAGTLIFFEAPGRLEATLGAMAEVFGPDCKGAVARELTKLHEETRQGSLAELRHWSASEAPRGEFVILIAPVRAADTAASDGEILAALAQCAGHSVRDRVDAVAAQLRAPRKKVYDLALRSRKD